MWAQLIHIHEILIELHFTHTHRDICGFWGSFLSMDTAQSDSDMSIQSLLWLLITRARDCDVHVHVQSDSLKTELDRAT